jgi:Flp pilus assembly protein CpaB
MASSDKDPGKPASNVTARAVMRLSPRDNVAVALRPLKAGETVTLDDVAITIRRHIAVGHKFAAQAIEKGEIILKYNCPIGTAISRIVSGEYVHTHNVESNYLPTYELPK